MTHILSIDWDYFVGCDAATRSEYFPDGHEGYSRDLENMIWAIRYNCYSECLNKPMTDISYHAEDVARVCDILEKNSGYDAMITNSHLALFGFANKYMMGNNTVCLYNIDFHHDMYNGNSACKSVDCGNWASQLLSNSKLFNNKFEYYWCPREDSDLLAYSEKNFGETSVFKQGCNQFSLSQLEKVKRFDAVFLCRSSMWSPPHLDKAFFDLASAVTKCANPSAIMTDGITFEQPRTVDSNFNVL